MPPARWASGLPKRYILSTIYTLRSVAIITFLAAPLTPWSVYIFSSVMGLLWLSTVPLTNAVVAQIFGVQYLSMLGGFVFLSHQIGSFMGVWLGGKLYDATGSYDVVWWIAVALGRVRGARQPAGARARDCAACTGSRMKRMLDAPHRAVGRRDPGAAGRVLVLSPAGPGSHARESIVELLLKCSVPKPESPGSPLSAHCGRSY